MVLDVFPYNKVSLTCSVVVYPTTTIHSAIYQWTGNNAPQSSTSTPTVSVLATSAGKSSYQCHVNVSVSQLNTAVTSTSTTVTVKGIRQPLVVHV